MYRGSISFVLIVAQLSVAYDPLNVHQIQTTGDPSSPLPVFPGDDSGFTGISGISNPEDPMVDGGQRRQNQDSFNNDGNFELVSGGKGCPPGQNGRGKRRARRSNPEFCPATLQVRHIMIRIYSREWHFSRILLTSLPVRTIHHPISPKKRENSRVVREENRAPLECNRIHQKYRIQMIQIQTPLQSCWNSWTSHNPTSRFVPGN